MSKIKFIIAGIAITTVSLFGSSLKAEAAMWNVDMNLACRQQHGGRYIAYVRDNNAYGWRCKNGKGDDYDFGRKKINVMKYCQDNHNDARSDTRNPNNPFSWRCIK